MSVVYPTMDPVNPMHDEQDPRGGDDAAAGTADAPDSPDVAALNAAAEAEKPGWRRQDSPLLLLARCQRPPLLT